MVAVARHGHTAGGKPSPTYFSWANMIQRVTNPKAQQYSDYGGRGITVCDRWRLFDDFLADMGERPVGTTLDRKDSNGNYEPGNCRWATRSQQQSNKRRNPICLRGHNKDVVGRRSSGACRQCRAEGHSK